MKHYLFIDRESGEEILIEAKNLHEATERALRLFCDDPEFICTMNDFEAEMSGLDEI